MHLLQRAGDAVCRFRSEAVVGCCCVPTSLECHVYVDDLTRSGVVGAICSQGTNPGNPTTAGPSSWRSASVRPVFAIATGGNSALCALCTLLHGNPRGRPSSLVESAFDAGLRIHKHVLFFKNV
eukprot:COSAG02_NODE_3520_length_6620_cov_3.440423_1_plen_124_part_00